MKKVANVAVFLVALLHVWFFVLETFLWRTDFAAKALQMSPAEAAATAVLAGNQGVYNAVIAAGLFWGLSLKDAVLAFPVRRFFLVSVIAVGIYGAVSARILVLFMQVMPAAIALVLTMLAARETQKKES